MYQKALYLKITLLDIYSKLTTSNVRAHTQRKKQITILYIRMCFRVCVTCVNVGIHLFIEFRQKDGTVTVHLNIYLFVI